MSAQDEVVPLQGGRSNHVWHVRGRSDAVVKVFDRSSRNPMFENDPRHEAICLMRLAGTGMVPKFVGTGEFDGWTWLIYRHLIGQPWVQQTEQVAHLLGRLHDQTAPEGFALGVNGSEALATQTYSILHRCAGSQVQTLLDLRPNGHVEPSSQTSLIHGDPVPGNLLVHDGTLTLIDWQCPKNGDPAEDLAIFASPAMQSLYRGRPLSETETAEFLAAYPNPLVARRYLRLSKWYHWRMAAYCLWKTQQGHADYSEAMELEIAELRRSVHEA
ncbi:MAG: phosphotransferase [Rhodobacteraceae bacterium]|nr:phosphotransferase [Paracoccaceae bacterium]